MLCLVKILCVTHFSIMIDKENSPSPIVDILVQYLSHVSASPRHPSAGHCTRERQKSRYASASAAWGRKRQASGVAEMGPAPLSPASRLAGKTPT